MVAQKNKISPLRSVRGRLLAAFIGISLFSLVAAAAGLYGLSQLDRSLKLLTEQRVPQATAWLEVSNQVERVLAAAPKLIVVDSEEDRIVVSALVCEQAERLSGLLPKATGDTELNAQSAEQATQWVKQLDDNLVALDTQVKENTDPDIIVELLNAYIEGLAKIIFAHSGTVMKIIGDALQATFGAPLHQDDHAARAVKSALEIDAFAEKFRTEWNARGINLGTTRIGINAGEAIIGNFGGDSLFDYTAYGDAVNTVARLESANKTLGTRICVSASIADRIDCFKGRPAGELRLAGKSGTLAAFEPMSAEEYATPAMAAYRATYTQLASGDTDARQSFAARVAEIPNDPLTLFHLQRALGGANDVIVDTSTH